MSIYIIFIAYLQYFKKIYNDLVQLEMVSHFVLLIFGGFIFGFRFLRFKKFRLELRPIKFVWILFVKMSLDLIIHN